MTHRIGLALSGLLLGCTVTPKSADFSQQGTGTATAGVTATATATATDSGDSSDGSTGSHDPTATTGEAPPDPPPEEPEGSTSTGPEGPTSECGNGVVEGSEGCDGADFGGGDCISMGFEGGELTCTDQCSLSTESCVGCGDGILNGDEVCDGADVGTADCEGQGLTEGLLLCNDDCSGFDTSQCGPEPFCGDGQIDGDEQCDGADLGAGTCVNQGFISGDIACAADCTYDTTTCSNVCLNEGEICNGPNDCCNTGCGKGGATCIHNGNNVCCT